MSTTAIMDGIADLQRRGIFSKERIIALRRYCCRSIGLSICLYCLFQIIVVIYLIVKVSFRLIIFILLPTKNIYNLLWLSSTCASIYLTKIFRWKDSWRFLLPLLIQIFFILVPLLRHEQQTRSYSMIISNQSTFEEHLNHYSSSIDTAFTDLHCYDYTKSMDLNKQNYIYFLNTYRYRSPFAIYLSIIKSNGPICQSSALISSCAIPWKIHDKRNSSPRWGFVLLVLLLVSLVIFKWLSHQRKFPDLHPSIAKKLHYWLIEEEKINYGNLLQTINEIVSSSDVSH